MTGKNVQSMIPKSLLEKHKTLLRTVEILPSHWIGEFASNYLKNLKGNSELEQIHLLCGLMEALYSLGINQGKKESVEKIKSLILG